MYAVSADYLTAHKKPVHQKKIKGTVGNVSITENNISAGSLMIHNQCSESPDIKLGAVYIGTMECTFLNNTNIDRYSWKGKVISLEEGLKVASSYQYVPKGIWTIAEAKWNREGVSITAYDNMRKLDKPFPYTQINASTPFDILETICTDCHVECGMEDLNDFCNGDSIIYMTDPGDIETYQDALFWLAQALCAFATIDRTGKLVLRRFVSDPVDTVQSSQRYNESSFSDYETRYTGISVIDMAENKTKYYHAAEDDGSTINLGANPFLQSLTRDMLMQNILEEVQQIQYVPFSAALLDGAFYDLGDVIENEDGYAGTSSKCIIMYFDDNYNNRFEMQGFGADPGLSSAKSKSEKNIQGLINSVDKNEFRDYELKNTSLIQIHNEEKTICSLWIASNTSTKALIHMQFNLESEADNIVDDLDVEIEAEESGGEIVASGTISGDELFRFVGNKTTKAVVRYLINSEEVSVKPEEEWIDGKHILHLMYVQSMEAGIPVQFIAKIKTSGGKIKIPKGCFWFYASGRGLVGDGKWDGTIAVEDGVSDFEFINMTFAEVLDSVTVSKLTPTGVVKTDTIADWNVMSASFENVVEIMNITLHQDSVQRSDENDEPRLTEDGNTRYTEGE